MFAFQDMSVEANFFWNVSNSQPFAPAMIHGLRVRKTKVRPVMPASSVVESSESAWNDSTAAHRILFTR